MPPAAEAVHWRMVNLLWWEHPMRTKKKDKWAWEQDSEAWGNWRENADKISYWVKL